jgi:enediyne biosynthesis protein E4
MCNYLLDLVLFSYSNQHRADQAYFKPRYFQNNKGQWTSKQFFADNIRINTRAALDIDIDHDGDQDLLVLSAFKPMAYPYTQRSYLFENKGSSMLDATEKKAPYFKKREGLFTEVLLANNVMPNKKGVLVLSLWGEPLWFELLNNTLAPEPIQLGPKGWWQSAYIQDITGDGQADIVLGNEGLNTFYRASAKEPIRLLAKDFDLSGSIDPILSYFKEGTSVLHTPLGSLAQQIPSIKNLYTSYAAYAKAEYSNFIPKTNRKGALELEAHELRNGYLLNLGNGKYTFKALPLALQTAPITGFAFNNRDHSILINQNIFTDDATLGYQQAGGYFNLKLLTKGFKLNAKSTNRTATIAVHEDTQGYYLLQKL